jgi:hypothetical protein
LKEINMVRMTQLILLCGLATFGTGPAFSTPAKMVIDWTVCKQPDLATAEHKVGTNKLISKYEEAAKKPVGTHIAVGLNREYGVAVQDRRDHVRLNYIPLGPNRSESQCALSDANYAKLLQFRDASYYVMCRSEVAIGTSTVVRAAKNVKALTYAAIYDFAKATGLYEMRAKPDEPTTPPGGFAACSRGTEDGKKDPLPTAEDVAKFKTRLTVPDSEAVNIGDPTKQ